MIGKWTTVALVATVLSVTSASAQQNDGRVIRLGDQPAVTANPAGDTVLVWGHCGSYGGYYGGSYGDYYGGYYPSYSGYGYGSCCYPSYCDSSYGYGSYGYPSYYGYGSYYPSYYSGYYPSYGGYGSYYPSYYGNGSYYPGYYGSNYGYGSYYPSSYGSYYDRNYGYGPRYYPMAQTKVIYGGTVGSYNGPARAIERTGKANQTVQPVLPREGTFRYDGGPVAPVPMPKINTQRQKAAPIDPSQGRIATLPNQTPKYTYRAYGEKDTPTVLIKDDSVKAARR